MAALLPGAPTTRTDAKLEVEALGVAFGAASGAALQVIRDLSLAVDRGEFVTIIGPSGSGKSTLLNVISGLYAAELTMTGGVTIKWDQSTRTRGSLGYVFQRDTLFPWRTVQQNVEIGLQIAGTPRKERSRTARDWLARVGLSGFEDVYPRQLSGGMRQRVNIARTLAHSPEIILMDEPFASLDAHTRLSLQQMIVDLWRETSATVLFVTHDLEESILLGQRVLRLSSRPAHIAGIYPIDLDKAQSVIDLKADAAFHQMYRTIWDDLKEDVAASSSPRR